MKRKLLRAALLLLLFAALAPLVLTGVTQIAEDAVYSLVSRAISPPLTAFLRLLTHLGDPIPVALICTALLLIPKARREAAPAVCFSVLLATGLNLALKHAFTRERPDILRLIEETGFSFPSGHAMTNAALYLTLILLLPRLVRSSRLRTALIALFSVIAFLIGCSRVYLGVHYAADVLGGWILGAAVALFSCALWETLASEAS